MTAALLIVAKAPEPGRVKTRLTPALTPVEAADVAAAALLDTLETAHATGAVVIVALAGDLGRSLRGGEIRSRLSHGIVVAQRGDTFSDRLAHAHLDARALHPSGPIVQIGSDTPQVAASLLSQAANDLAAGDVDGVLGPAPDGGWWALGLRDAKHAEVLRTVPMSSPSTGAGTMHGLHTRGLRIASLPALRDVDSVTDAVVVAEQIPRSRFARVVSTVLSKPVARTPVGDSGRSESPL
jgi:hypothetical protein